jgi:hypothetical protein
MIFDRVGSADQDAINNYVGTGANRDILDVSALLDSVFTTGQNVNNFIRVTDVGSDALVQVDLTGSGTFSASGNIATLSNTVTPANVNTGATISVFFENAEQQVVVV